MGTEQLSKAIGRLRATLEKPGAQPASDADLLTRYLRNRDEAAFAAIVRRHGPMVLGVCNRVLRNHADAQDALQATFLILVRKAGSVRSPAMLASWLYGVACRTAQEARRMAATRRMKEAAATARPDSTMDTKSELLAALDLELERLPEKLRVVIVLCDLEGKTRKEAAKQLGWPEGTVAGRLARGRALLAKRLSRYGIMISVAALAEQLAEAAAASLMATSLLAVLVEAASAYGLEQVAGGALSAKAVTLAEGVLKTMLLTKLKIVTALLFAAVTVVGIGAGVASPYFAGQNQNQDKPKLEPKFTERPKEADAPVLAATPRTLRDTYLSNEAMAEETYVGKTMKVTGDFRRIKRTGDELAPYELIMHGWSSLSEPMVSKQKTTEVPLIFKMRQENSAQLAMMSGQQTLTIEGRCRGLIQGHLPVVGLMSTYGNFPLPKEDRKREMDWRVTAIGFENCKISSISNPNLHQWKKGAATTATALARVFRDNDAMADECLNGQTMRVTGFLSRVKRNDLFPEKDEKFFLLMMDSMRTTTDTPVSIVLDFEGLEPIRFVFKESARKELAALKPWQQVTIEAKCIDKRGNGLSLPETGTVLFENCKIVSAEKPSAN